MSQPWDKEFQCREKKKTNDPLKSRVFRKIDQLATAGMMVFCVYVLIAKRAVKPPQ